MSKYFDVTGIGNAIVDVLATTTDDFLNHHNMRKGTMALINAQQAHEIYSHMKNHRECAGGSVANSLAAMAELGAKVAFIGKVKDDAWGVSYQHGMQDVGVHYTTPAATSGNPTGCSYILVSPDGERTMNTYIGACSHLSKADMDEELIQSSRILFIEGYMWNQEAAIEAIRHAIAITKAAGGKVALTLSDVFCIENHHDDFTQLVSGEVDILFANEMEICTLLRENETENALTRIATQVPLVAVTMAEKGAVVLRGETRINVPTPTVEKVVDATGAGDMFAAGFLYGLSQGWDDAKAGALGCTLASHIIQQIGARSSIPLASITKAA